MFPFVSITDLVAMLFDFFPSSSCETTWSNIVVIRYLCMMFSNHPHFLIIKLGVWHVSK